MDSVYLKGQNKGNKKKEIVHDRTQPNTCYNNSCK